MSESFPYIRAIEVVHNRVTPGPFLIDLPPAEGKAFSHLILTGKNGSGKSSTLEAIAEGLVPKIQGLELAPGTQLPIEPASLVDVVIRKRQLTSPLANVFVYGLGMSHTHVTDDQALPSDDRERFLLSQLSASKLLWARKGSGGLFARLGPIRDRTIIQPEGPKLDSWGDLANSSKNVSANILQFLVNRRTEQSFAREDGDENRAAQIADWFNEVQSGFEELFEVPGLRLNFHRSQYDFTFDLPDGRSARFFELPDGLAAVLVMWSELAQRDMAVRRLHPEILHAPGLVIIDEIDAHLHLSLQEKILPFLTRLFPAVQFIVATHSPAVISSVDDAIVYDLSSHQAHPSAEFQGIRYGTLISGHFGLGHDLDRDSADKMARLGVLARQSPRSEAEEAELRALSSELSARSSSLALEVWTELEYKKRLAAKGIQG